MSNRAKHFFISNMKTTKIFLVFLFFTTTVTCADNCSFTRCSRKETTVRFPFSLDTDQQDSNCGYPGFVLSCDKTNTTVLQLGTSGKFLVREIDYVGQEVQIYDQHNCLPKRLLNLNLSDSPFTASHYSNFNFFNCSSDFTSVFLNPINCLSSPNHTVYATSSIGQARYMISICDLITSVMVPTEWPDYVAYPVNIKDDLRLTWNTPNCRDCTAEGGKCWFRNRNSKSIQCYDIPRRGVPRVVKYALIVAVGVPALMSLVLITCYFCNRVYGVHYNRHHHHVRHNDSFFSSALPPPSSVVGLAESVIQSYPHTVLGESRRLAKPDDNTCSICLSEYRPKEILKTIPVCHHCFHASCIDEWFRRNGTCPLCRNSPMPSPSAHT